MTRAGPVGTRRSPWLSIAIAHASSVLRPSLVFGALPAIGIGALAFVQDSVDLRRFGLPSGWESLAEFMLLVSLATPLVWALVNRPEALAWERRLCRVHARLVMSRIAGLFAALISIQGALAVTMITVERIMIGEASAWLALGAFGGALVAGLPLAALAPCLIAFSSRSSNTVLIWLLLSASSLGALGLGVPIPLDRYASLGEPGSELDARLVASVAASTLGGILVSIFLTLREQPPHRT